jgi:hypothetical protein
MFVAAGVNRTKNKMLRLVPSLLGVVLVFVFLLLDIHAASAAPLSAIRVNAIPAFARKYGMPCSSCHLAWPMLSPFGQAFKDNG